MMRIVPAVRAGAQLPDRDDGSLAPHRRPLLAWYQDAAPPGGLVAVFTPEARPSFTVILLDAGGKHLARGTSFRWGTGWLSLVGVPATARPGAHQLWLPGVRLRFRVTARVFVSETIPLTKELTVLRTEPDARKTAEAVELARLLAGSDVEARYETGPFAWPIARPRRTAGYGDRRAYQYDDGSTALAVHNGLDLALPEGTPVGACGAGRVVMAKERVVTGWSVVVEHLPGLYSLYYHLGGIAVRQGDLVAKGQVVGTLGKTGLATGPHLHWEIQAGGIAVDPDRLLAGLPFVPGAWPVPALFALPSRAPD
jgi:murein DD-endopeptidase MepM/ murein hydrolase activator NlpD